MYYIAEFSYKCIDLYNDMDYTNVTRYLFDFT